jgi:hypothetical protein
MGKSLVPISLLVLALCVGRSLSAASDDVSYQATPCIKENVAAPEDYKVFIDKSTDFAFVCTPVGWKFVGKAGPEAL